MTEKEKEKTRERQKRRRQRLDEIALAHGFITWTKLETAALEGRLIIIRPTESAPSTVHSTDISSD